MTSIILEEHSNGWSAKNVDVAEGVEETIVGEVYCPEDFADFLLMVFTAWGPQSSRYDKDRLVITTLPGDKFDGVLELEKINEMRELRDELDSHILKFEEVNGVNAEETLHETGL